MKNPFIRIQYRDDKETVARLRETVKGMLLTVCKSLPDPRADGARFVLEDLLNTELKER